jgi:hypothetical protein
MILVFPESAYSLQKRRIMRLNFIDPQTLARLIASPEPADILDPKREIFLDNVRQTILALPDLPGRVVVMTYFEQKDIDEIACELNLPASEIKRLLKDAKLNLKNALTGLVKDYWPKKFGHLKTCPICNHPKREIIEGILTERNSSLNWAAVNKQLKLAINESFNPPSILIYHLKFHGNKSDGVVNNVKS